jgi:hypothetical protein
MKGVVPSATNFRVQGKESEVISRGGDMSLLNGDKARENRRRRARIKMRVKGRALRQALEGKRLEKQQRGAS